MSFGSPSALSRTFQDLVTSQAMYPMQSAPHEVLDAYMTVAQRYFDFLLSERKRGVEYKMYNVYIRLLG